MAFSSSEVREYRATVMITDKRSKPPLTLAHDVTVPAFDIADALVQCGFRLQEQGLFDPNDHDFELRVANIQPATPPYSTLTGAIKGSLDERLAKYLNSVGY